ncbi:ABC transporter permease [Limnohabitans sp. JirII-31]|uniref:ABC transporter permease n=1 Tax=Limnohabitans sp. JirII-31 TaxID=1977908 RepID=UPI000C1F70C6|nr:ABC transporter permease [Limnohabitans sp. JirII-31]PIT80742.1 ABC transporter permease [Limnohabitans sp. JirII-31]
MRHTRLLSVMLGLLCLGLWELAVQQLATSALVLPAPTVIASSLWRGLGNGYLWPHVLQTLSEVGLGLLLGGTLGFAGGVALGESARLRGVLMPYVVLSQVVPKLALAPLFIVWFGFGTLPTVVMTALICFFPLLENTATCMQQVDAQRLELFRMLRATPWQTLWRLKIPAGLPHIMAGLRVAVVLAWVGAVVGEFIGGSKGLGALIIAAQGSMDTPLMFAVLVLITVLGLLSYSGVQALERRFSPFPSSTSSKV